MSTDQKISPDRPWVVVTGASRGIGAALVKAFAGRVNVFALARQAQVPQAQAVFEADLAEPFTQDTLLALQKALGGKKIWGFLHCAGVLGPVGQSGEKYAEEFVDTLQINFVAGVECVRLLLPYLEPDLARNPPFVFHLSSGAARNGYVGWEAYCASKAAMLSYFKCLAKAFSADKLCALSIAPGTVDTDMMQGVLGSDPTLFPDVSKFHDLKQRGELASPEKVGAQIAELLLGGKNRYAPLHGLFYDLRKGVPE